MAGVDACRQVRTYAEKGWHRTGSSVEGETLLWLERELAVLGAEITLQNYYYQHFEGQASLQKIDRRIRCMPLYYSAVGQHKIKNPAIAMVDAHASEANLSAEISGYVNQARQNWHDGLILATECATGSLCAINQSIESQLDFPVVLIPGNDFDHVSVSDLQVDYSASVHQAESSNLIARFRGQPGQPIVITTPISGWFNCTGERGCGIAIAIQLANILSSDFPVDLLFASGHELGYLGGYALADHYPRSPRCILHLGSCIANLNTELISICSTDSNSANAISRSIACLDSKFTVPDNPADAENWIGESECWAPRQRKMLSIAGLSPHFHTPDDLPVGATTAELLDQAIEAISSAVRILAVD
jgi:hypothetical protein